jgi:uncharacterized protein (DUF433 family)
VAGQHASVGFILTVVGLHEGNRTILNVTEYQLLEIIQLYEGYETKSTAEGSSRNITKYEAIILVYVVEYLQKHTGSKGGNIVIDGEKVPVRYILDQLDKRHIDVRRVTVVELYAIIQVYIQNKTTQPKPVPLGKQPTTAQITELEIIVAFLKTQGIEAKGTFRFEGYKISIKFILQSVKDNGKDIRNITYKELWNIILVYVQQTKQI